MDAARRAEISQKLAEALINYIDCIAEESPRLVQKEDAKPKYYDSKELAALLKMKPEAINRKMRAGEFGETVNTSSRRKLVTEDGLAYYIKSHKGPSYTPKRTKQKRIIPIPGMATERI